jgi:NADH dehydrogenase
LITGKEAFLATQPVNNSGDSQPNKNKQPVNL